MAIKTYKPTTAARRNMSVTDYTSLSKNGPEKSLLAPLDARSTALSTSSARSTT